MTSIDADLVQSFDRLQDTERSVILEFLQSKASDWDKLSKHFQSVMGDTPGAKTPTSD